MTTKQEINKNTVNNMNCSLCAKFINILKHKPESETELKCDECGDDNDPVVAVCVNCKSYLCQDCNKVHSKKNKIHDIVSLSSITDATTQSTEKVLYCPEHRKNELDYYCETCDKLLCIYCATKREHAEHTHEQVEKMASKHRGMLAEMIAPVEEMSRNLSKAEANIVSIQEKIKAQASEIDQEIDNCYVEQLQELNKHHKQLKERLHDAVSQKETALKEQLKNVKSVQDELVKLTKLREGLDKAPDSKVLSTKKQDIEGRIQKVSKQYKTLNTQPAVYDTLEFAPTKTCTSLLGHLFISASPHTSEVVNLPAVAYCGCKLEFKIITKDSKGCNCTKGGSQVSVQLKSFTGNVTAGEVRDNNDGSYMASFVAEQVGEEKLSVSINGEQIKGSPYSIVVGRNYQAIDKPSKIVNDNGSMKHPEGIAFSKEGMWAVADWDGNCTYIFDEKDELINKFGNYGNSNGQFNYPHGVAFDSHNHLYVADYGNNRVQKFNIKGSYLNQFGSYGYHDGQLNRPYGVTIHHSKVYVADRSNYRISVFQTDGQFCFTFGSDRLADPSDIAVSSNSELLVADHSNHCIYIFTLDGYYVRKFGSPGSGRGQFKYPFLTTDLNGFIIVTEEGNHRLSIFDQDGSCIHCFGSKGSAIGQFSSPYGVAVSPIGRIYVSDRGNKKIQIFSNGLTK